jgi:hypothetical protein
LTAYAADGSELLSFEPYVWDDAKIDSIAGPLVWREADSSTDGYRDVEAEISKDGVRKLHEHFRHWMVGHAEFAEADLKRRSADDPYRPEAEGHAKRLRARLETMDDLVSDKTPDDTRFVICVFEWESGL